MLVLASVFTLFSCTGGKTQRELFAMDTYMYLTVYEKNADDALGKAVDLITELDAKFSVSAVAGEIETLNRQGFLDAPSKELITLLTLAKQVYERTDGAYDVTSLAVTELWAKCENEGRMPTEAELSEALTRIGMGRITFDSGRVDLNGVRGIDLGSIAKGYAGQTAAETLAGEGMGGGILTLGGNVVTFRQKPDGKPFKIGVTDPNAPERVCGYLTLGATNIVTSGKYNRYYEIGGERYHHIIDVKTGMPSESGIASVTVVCESGAMADALSTALFIIGKEKALDYYSRHGGFEAVIVTDDGEITVTEGLKSCFEKAK
jgi:thiamine biosynthesis lipoprotein